MEEQINELLGSMTLDELGDVVKSALSRIYNKLREDEGFSYVQYASFTSFGEKDYDVEIVIVDDDLHSSGLNWPKTWRI